MSKTLLQLTLLAGVAIGLIHADDHMAPAGNVCKFGITPSPVDGVCRDTDGNPDGIPPRLTVPEGQPIQNTCFDPVDMHVVMTLENETAAVRCFSPSTNISLTPQPCAEVNRTEAERICSEFRGIEGTPSFNLTDYRLPETPDEAGMGCGTGCGFDGVPLWLSFTPPPSVSPTETPTMTTEGPTSAPTAPTTVSPTGSPTLSPTSAPTAPTAPTTPTTTSPTESPTGAPTGTPTDAPTGTPTGSPTGTVGSPTPTFSPPTSAAPRLVMLFPFYVLLAAVAMIALY